MKVKIDNLKLRELNEAEELGLRNLTNDLGKDKKNSKDSDEDSSANILMTLRRIANHPLLHRYQLLTNALKPR